MIYELVDKYLMHDFTDQISEINKHKKKLIIFDVGCYKGIFSKKMKNHFNDAIFFLFDANKDLKFDNFNFYPIALYNKKSKIIYQYNTFLPSAGSGIDSVTINDKFWNFTRSLLSLSFRQNYQKRIIETSTLDIFSKKNKIKKIDILKIDVEGSELKVLEGGKAILRKTNLILIEVISKKKNFNKKYLDTVNYLNKLNFKLIEQKKIYSTSILSNIKSMDLLFLKKNINCEKFL